MVRTTVNRLIDQFLLAYSIGDACKRTNFLSETKLQKLAFISEKEMTKTNERGFGYYFIKLYYGPYSQSLRNDLKSFVDLKIVETEKAEVGTKIIPTEKCTRILQDFGSISLRNKAFLKTVTEVNRQYAPLEFKKLLNSVYRMQSPLAMSETGERTKTIARYPLRAPLLKPIQENAATKVFTLTPSEIATLEIYLEKDTFDSLTKAVESARTKPLMGFDEVF